MQLTCDNASALVPSYLDEELTEAQAAPLRRHLLACPACREVAKELTALKRWFVADAAPAIPAGFAARVARRAFAGDPGTLVPQEAPELGERPAGASGEVLPFVLRLTAAAAAVLLVFAIGIRMQTIPDSSEGLRADDLDVWGEIYGDLPDDPAAPVPGIRPLTETGSGSGLAPGEDPEDPDAPEAPEASGR